MVQKMSEVHGKKIWRGGEPEHEDFSILVEHPELFAPWKNIYVHGDTRQGQYLPDSIVTNSILTDRLIERIGRTAPEESREKAWLTADGPPDEGGWWDWAPYVKDYADYHQAFYQKYTTNVRGRGNDLIAMYLRPENILLMGDFFHGSSEYLSETKVKVNKWRVEVMTHIAKTLHNLRTNVSDLFRDLKVDENQPVYVVLPDGHAYRVSTSYKQARMLKGARILEETEWKSGMERYQSELRAKMTNIVVLERKSLDTEKARITRKYEDELAKAILLPQIDQRHYDTHKLQLIVNNPPYVTYRFPVTVVVEGAYYFGTMLKLDKPFQVPNIYLDLVVYQKRLQSSHLRRTNGTGLHWYHGNDNLCNGDALKATDVQELTDMDRIVALRDRIMSVVAWPNLDDSTARGYMMHLNPPISAELGPLSHLLCAYARLFESKTLDNIVLEIKESEKVRVDAELTVWDLSWDSGKKPEAKSFTIPGIPIEAKKLTGRIVLIKEWIQSAPVSSLRAAIPTEVEADGEDVDDPDEDRDEDGNRRR